jgi:putative transposase
MDFAMDHFREGWRFRVFTLVDDFSRECPASFADTSIAGVRVVRLLEELAVTRGLPQTLVSDISEERLSGSTCGHRAEEKKRNAGL